MLDLERVTDSARAAVEQRRTDALNAEIAEEAAQLAHREMLTQTSAAMIAGQERARAQRIARHAESVSTARAAKDRLAVLVHETEVIDQHIGSLKADLHEAQKRLSRCAAPSPESFPTEAEIAAYRQERGQHEEAVQRLHGLIAAETRRYDDALHAQWEGEARFREAARVEWERRSEL